MSYAFMRNDSDGTEWRGKRFFFVFYAVYLQHGNKEKRAVRLNNVCW